MCLDFEEVAKPRWVYRLSSSICVVTDGLSLTSSLSLGSLVGRLVAPTSQKTFNSVSYCPGAVGNSYFPLSFHNLFIVHQDKNFPGSYCMSVKHLWPPSIPPSIHSQVLNEFLKYMPGLMLCTKDVVEINESRPSFALCSLQCSGRPFHHLHWFQGLPFLLLKRSIHSTLRGVSAYWLSVWYPGLAFGFPPLILPHPTTLPV